MTTTDPPFPPVTISFAWQEHEGEIVGIRATVDDGVTDAEPWWMTGGSIRPDAYPEVMLAWKYLATVGAIRNWRERRGPS